MIGNRPIRFAIGALLVVILGGSLYWFTQNPAVGAAIDYNPPFNPGNFIPQITNKYFTLVPGKKFMYTKNMPLPLVQAQSWVT